MFRNNLWVHDPGRFCFGNDFAPRIRHHFGDKNQPMVEKTCKKVKGKNKVAEGGST